MGDNFLLQQIQNFERGRDLALQEMKFPALFERPEAFETIYTAHPLEGVDLCEEETLYGVAATTKRTVYLVRGHKRVAYIDGDGVTDLWKGLRQPGALGVTRMCILEVFPLSGIAKARIVEE